MRMAEMPVGQQQPPAGFYAWLRPLLFRLNPETAHGLAIRTLQLWQHCPWPGGAEGHGAQVDSLLRQRLWHIDFANPVGLAAGFDKNGQVWRGVLRLGFGFAEIGSVTPVGQAGNPRPRLFRLAEAEAVLNRMGFNNAGIEAMARQLRKDGRDQARRQGPLGINLGKNKSTADAAADYEIGIRELARFADYLVINISSPNTPGLRALQGREPLELLVQRARQALDALALDPRPPLLLKIAPDLTAEDLADIAAVALAGGLDGLIVSNTTITRPDVAASWSQEAGGLSGRPLFALSTAVLGEVYRLTQGRLPLIGVGGIGSAADAYAKIRAGASLVQLYSALIYRGPMLARQINEGLAALLRRDGFGNVAEAVGADHR